jgi:hypothetical protein
MEVRMRFFKNGFEVELRDLLRITKATKFNVEIEGKGMKEVTDPKNIPEAIYDVAVYADEGEKRLTFTRQDLCGYCHEQADHESWECPHCGGV